MLSRYYRSSFFGLLLLLLLLVFSPVHIFAQDEQLRHTVQPGENLYRIALRYGVDINELARMNNIVDQRRVLSGQVLIIPGLSIPDSSSEVTNPLIAGTPTIHVVQPGESLSMIAQRYGLTVDQLLQANDIPNPNRIYRGQELTVWTTESVNTISAEPENAPADVIEGAAPDRNLTYVVQPGESLSMIARRYGMSWTVLAQVNGISNPDRVFEGQVLTIPAINSDGGFVDMGIIQPVLSGPAPTITTGKQIIVSLSQSRIYAYEDGVLLRSVVVSTGLPATPTVQGDFRIWHRTPSQTMSGPGYRLPNVQWVQYFYQAYAIHGTYWHNNFGRPMSHGCVNLPNDEAEWFYHFAEIGTPVRVQV